MPFSMSPYQCTEAKMLEVANSNNGFNLFWTGTPFIQYAAATSLTNSTAETSLFAGITTLPANGQASTTTANFGVNYPMDCSTLYIPGNVLTPGAFLKYHMAGTIATTGTPTLRIRPGFITGAGTFAGILDSTALTLPTITGTNDFTVDAEMVCISAGATGSVGVRMAISFGTNSTTMVSTVLLIPYAVLSVDTTQTYQFDIRATWGSASTSNVLINKAGYIQVIG